MNSVSCWDSCFTFHKVQHATCVMGALSSAHVKVKDEIVFHCAKSKLSLMRLLLL